jgi:hypothetical protein
MYGLQCPASADEGVSNELRTNTSKRVGPHATGESLRYNHERRNYGLVPDLLVWLRRSQLSLLPEQPPLFAVPVAGLFGLALIVQLLSSGQRDLDLRPALLGEINF